MEREIEEEIRNKWKNQQRKQRHGREGGMMYLLPGYYGIASHSRYLDVFLLVLLIGETLMNG